MNQNSDDIPGPESIAPFAEANAYLEKLGVAAKGFPSDRLERLQLLLTTEPDAGCRVWPDPTWDPNECQEACEEHWRELDDLKAYIEAFRQGGLSLAETTMTARLEARQEPEPPKISKEAQALWGVDLSQFASTDRRTATERALDCYRDHVRQTNAQKAAHQPPQVQPEPGKDSFPV
jgi:hypothetical protein